MNKGELTRQRIIATAAPLFNQRGFDGCSMQDVMEAAHLEKGGIYRHFSSKEELAAECFQFSLAKAMRSRSGEVDHIPNAVEQLRYLVHRFVSASSPVPGGCPLMNTAIDADDGNAHLRRLALQGLRDWRDRLIQVVDGGIARGEIRDGTDSVRIANTMVALLEGSLMISRMEGSTRALDDAKASFEAVLGEIAADRGELNH
ncbi:MAG: pXO2 [Acidobacteriaceae bacterium]|nr:pXO2 [Acidobacteriaceae bacterium]